MGSNFSRHICCVICGRCKKQDVEAANEEISETKPILQTSGETSICFDTAPSTPALDVSGQGSEEVQSRSQDQWPSADAVEENMETCSTADPMGMTKGGQAASDSTGFLVTPADGETKEDVKGLTQADNHQEKPDNTEEKIKPTLCALEGWPVTHPAQDVELIAVKEQPEEQAEAGSEGSLCTGVTLQEGDILSFIKISNKTASGQDCGTESPAETGESLTGRNSPLCAVQMAEGTETYLSTEHAEDAGRAKLAEVSPQPAVIAELMCLVESASLLTVQAMQKTRETVEPSEMVANAMAETCSASAMPSEPLYPEGEPLEPVNQLLLFLEQETQFSMPAAQEMESLCCAEPAEPSEALCQSGNGVLCEPAGKESRECDAETAASEAEPQHRIMQQTELPEEPVTSVQQAAECLTVTASLSEVPGSSREIEAEDVEACNT